MITALLRETAGRPVRKRGGTVAQPSSSDLLEVVRALGADAEDRIVRRGLPASSWDVLAALGFSRAEIAAAVGSSASTIQRKTSDRRVLDLVESDRTMRLLRIIAAASDAIGSHEKAMRWLHSPTRFFGGRTALDMIATDAGATIVRQSLDAIEYGGVA